MYRAGALAAIRRGVSMQDDEALTNVAESIEIEALRSDRKPPF